MNRGLHGAATIVLSSTVALLGLAMVVVTLVGGGGPLSRGVLVGLLFVLAGGGRAWLAWRGPLALREDHPARDDHPDRDGARDA